MSGAPVLIHRQGPVLVAALNRADKKNALTGEMYSALNQTLETASDDDEIRAVLIASEGAVFTAGNDINDFAARAMAGGDLGDSPGGKFIRALARFEKPLVAAVDGLAVGIGTTLCFHCDLVYASPRASFKMPFVDLGLVPEAGSSRLATQRFGWAKAAEFLLLGESFGAEEALRLGFVNEIVAADVLRAHALAKAQALAAKPRNALLTTRRLMRGDAQPLYDHIEVELQAFAAAVRSPEARTAFMAFLSRSKG